MKAQPRNDRGFPGKGVGFMEKLAQSQRQTAPPRLGRQRLGGKKDYALLLFLLPGIVFLIFFRYAPMSSIVTAFQDYNIFKGIAHSPWVGFKHFRVLFASSDFKRILVNTVCISVGKLLFTFPMSILLAIMINEITQWLCKKV